MPSLPTAAVQTAMLRADSAHSLQGVPNSTAGAMESHRRIVRRNADILCHAVERFLGQFDAADHLGLLGLQGGKHLVYTGTGGLKEALVRCGLSGLGLF